MSLVLATNHAGWHVQFLSDDGWESAWMNGSALYQAIMDKDDAKAKAIYDATTERAEALLKINTPAPAKVDNGASTTL